MGRGPSRSNPDWEIDDPWHQVTYEPPLPWPVCEVTETDPEIVGRILGPDGETIAIVLDRPVVPFGFQPRAP